MLADRCYSKSTDPRNGHYAPAQTGSQKYFLFPTYISNFNCSQQELNVFVQYQFIRREINGNALRDGPKFPPCFFFGTKENGSELKAYEAYLFRVAF